MKSLLTQAMRDLDRIHGSSDDKDTQDQ
jgi:hypothetical protein